MATIQVSRIRAVEERDGEEMGQYRCGMWCKNCGATSNSVSCAPRSFGSRYAHAPYGTSPAGSVIGHYPEDARDARADIGRDLYCSLECYWSAELGQADSAMGSQASSRASNASMTLGVNPFAGAPEQRERKRPAWDPSEGLQGSASALAQGRDAGDSAENAMFQFHGGLSSTFRPERTLRTLR